MEGFAEDEIESVLYIGREVSGQQRTYTCIVVVFIHGLAS